MFYIQKNNQILFADNNKQQLINTLPFTNFTEQDIQETSHEIENFLFVDSPEWFIWKSNQCRLTRDLYLKQFIDPMQLVIRWSSLQESEQQQIMAYRQYLLDIPQSPDFPKMTVLTYSQWQNQITAETSIQDTENSSLHTEKTTETPEMQLKINLSE